MNHSATSAVTASPIDAKGRFWVIVGLLVCCIFILQTGSCSRSSRSSGPTPYDVAEESVRRELKKVNNAGHGLYSVSDFHHGEARMIDGHFYVFGQVTVKDPHGSRDILKYSVEITPEREVSCLLTGGFMDRLGFIE